MTKQKIRVESLDYMRGLMALSVVIYHYVSWSLSSESSVDVIGSEHLLGKLGIYGVGIFYILSGISLAIIYDGKIKSSKDVAAFTIKRIFRILPLYWIAISAALTLSIASGFVNNQPYDLPLYKIFLNYSLLFGFIDPSAALTTGAWSIGNELVFYSIICLTYLVSAKNGFIFQVVSIFSVACCFAFSFYFLDSTSTLGNQWAMYINPFNQIMLFIAGSSIGRYSSKLSISNPMLIFIAILSSLAFIFYPVSGDKINLVSGWNRVFLSLICCAFVFSIYKLNPSFDSVLTTILAKLGEISYSIYLMHPIVSIPVLFVTSRLGMERWHGFTISFVIVLAVGVFTYKYIEKPMMKLGSNIAIRFKSKEVRVLQ